MTDVGLSLALLTEEELRDDPVPDQQFRLSLHGWGQVTPDGLPLAAEFDLRLSSACLADLMAQARAQQLSLSTRIRRQNEDREAFEEAVAEPVPPDTALLERVLVRLRRLHE